MPHMLKVYRLNQRTILLSHFAQKGIYCTTSKEYSSNTAQQVRDTQYLLHNKQGIFRTYCTTNKGYSGLTAQQARDIQDLLHNKQGIFRIYYTTSKGYSGPTAQ